MGSGARLGGLVLLLFPQVALARHPDAARIIYMNRDGGEYFDGWPDDSSINRASVLQVERAVIPAYPHDVTWGQLVDCMRDVFADFDVYVTEEDPGDAQHVEIVVGGNGADIGWPDIGGVAPGTCEVLETAVVFVFGGASTDLDFLCWAAGQEVGHAFGLDHVTYCDDLMTYDVTCASRSYTDVDAYCGESSSRPCRCTGAETQNSYALLLERLGPHPPIVPPTVEITMPFDGAIVEPGFRIDVTASDDRAVEYVRLEIDGEAAGSDLEEPWGFTAPLDLADGTHEVTARALDGEGASGIDTVTVTISGDVGCADPPCEGGDAGTDAGEPRHREYGCGCDQSAAAPAGACLAMVLAAWRRKRR